MRRLHSTEASSEKSRSLAAARKEIETWFLFRIRRDGQFPPSILQPFLKSERLRQLIFPAFKTLTDRTVIVELISRERSPCSNLWASPYPSFSRLSLNSPGRFPGY